MIAIWMIPSQERFKPLTCSMNITSLPLISKTLEQYTADYLADQGFLDFSPVQNISRFITLALEKNQELILLDGNVVTDIDINCALKTHRQSATDLTLLTTQTPTNTTPLAICSCDAMGNLNALIPSPNGASAVSNQTLAGIYIFSYQAVRMLNDSHASDIFELISSLMPTLSVKTFEANGFWHPLRNLKDLLNLQNAILNNPPFDLQRSLDGCYGSLCSADFPGVTIIPPVYIGCDVRIARGATISQGSVIMNNCSIGQHAKIHASLLLDGSTVADDASITGGILAPAVTVGKGATVAEGAVLGYGVSLGTCSIVEEYVSIWPRKFIPPNREVTFDIQHGSLPPPFPHPSLPLSPIEAVRTAQAFARRLSAAPSANKNNVLLVGWRAESDASIGYAVAAGAAYSGQNVWLLEDTTYGALLHTSATHSLPAIFLAGTTQDNIHLLDTGLPLPLSVLTEIYADVNKHFNDVVSDGCTIRGSITRTPHIFQQYALYLQRLLPPFLMGTNPQTSASSPQMAALLKSLFAFKDDNADPITLQFTENGRLCVYTKKTGYVSHEQILLIVCRHYFRQNRNSIVPLPFSAPFQADNLGGNTIRYNDLPYAISDDLREAAKNVTFPRDALELAVRLIAVMLEKKLTLQALLADVPPFKLVTRFLPTDLPPTEMLSALCSKNSSSQLVTADGLVISSDSQSRVILQPLVSGLLVRAESYSLEVATELCSFYQMLLASDSDKF